ncbi:SH3 domain-containing protein [Sporosarcina sp. Marseille-Q4063]|uniref:SH3 domain-containing protein n=1 Tax=Sporosarcina sp. Marseille-Q4063 TaxID=2810514 RepID=UPI001BB0AA3B|nr:SH3 domain-containing protein [Sporosarcina sp. Marseille-Q4063]QUW22452.1 SH3 domain-containing protein [Sporosarcina sp. Marseille-Q4063]
MSRFGKIAFLFVLIFVLASDFSKTEAQSETAIIDTDRLNVRSGPGLSYGVISTLTKKDKVSILSSHGDWYEIKFKGKKGWIAKWYTINANEKKGVSTITSQVNHLNVRAKPSTSSPVLKQMNTGDVATKTGEQGEWTSVNVNGVEGWVHTNYISTKSQAKVNKSSNPSKELNYFTVAVNGLNVRSHGDLSSKRIDLIKKGSTYKVLEKSGNWVKLELGKGKSGWVYSFHGKLSTKKSNYTDVKTTPKNVYILSDGTNLRKNASTSSKVIMRANAGNQFPIVSETKDWYGVKLPSGETAFVAGWVVSINDEQAAKTKPIKKNRVAGTLNGLTIVIDPGHGGFDTGTIGVSGTFEKSVTQRTSEMLASKLRSAGANVILTRNMDTFISLQRRVSISHQYDADAFISVHYDASIDSSINGFTTYYTHSYQRQLAVAVNNGLGSTISLRNRGAQPANYLVLRENRQNAILLELGFLSNAVEESNVNNESFRERATQGIYQGLITFFDNQL